MAMPMDAKMTAAQKKQQAEWQAEDDLRSLRRAEEIQADPKRMAAAKALIGKYASALEDKS